jgi:hypothetical protein
MPYYARSRLSGLRWLVSMPHNIGMTQSAALVQGPAELGIVIFSDGTRRKATREASGVVQYSTRGLPTRLVGLRQHTEAAANFQRKG